jgi:HEPN domain-containing protein
MKEVTAEWVKKAEEDFVSAVHLCRKRSAPVPNAVCFHCQQCVEKYLKAMLVEADIRFPKSHDLMLLQSLLKGTAPFLGEFIEKLERLNDYAVEFRYPSESATRNDAKTALANCRVVRKSIRQAFGMDEPPSPQLKLHIKEKQARYRARKLAR